MIPLSVRAIGPDDLVFLREELVRHWVSPTIWSIDREYAADHLPGFVAWRGEERVGHLTLAPLAGESEIVTLSSRVENSGVGSALLEAAVRAAKDRGDRRIFLTMSNDNLRALGFYQRRGWRLVAVHRGMIDRYREREKEIPRVAANGIPVHDEIELELVLGAAADIA